MACNDELSDVGNIQTCGILDIFNIIRSLLLLDPPSRKILLGRASYLILVLENNLEELEYL